MTCSHFVEAQKLVGEGNRTYMNILDGKVLNIIEDDEEAQLIQKYGVTARVYSKELWEDKSALMAFMWEDNLDA